MRLAAGRRSSVTQVPHRACLVKREPLFNIPAVVVCVLGVLALVHVVRTFALSEQQDIEFLLNFAFIPERYDNSFVLGGALPGGGADVWTFVTYALIHANWTHLGVNAVWLLPVIGLAATVGNSLLAISVHHRARLAALLLLVGSVLLQFALAVMLKQIT